MSMIAAAFAVVACFLLGACGDEKTTTAPETVTETTTTTGEATADETTTPADAETADLPRCSEAAPPCIGPGGAVVEEGEIPDFSGSGETADLPLCADAPPPCRDDDGSVVEP